MTPCIAIHPADALFHEGSFLWRLTSEKRIEGGVFSKFPDYNHLLILVEGKALKLSFGDRKREREIQIAEGIEFSGDEPVSYDLVLGPVVELHLIFRRDRVHPHIQNVELSKKPRSFELEGKVTFVYGMAGGVRVSIYPGEESFLIQAGNTLHLIPSLEKKMILLDPQGVMGHVLLLEIDDRS